MKESEYSSSTTCLSVPVLGALRSTNKESSYSSTPNLSVVLLWFDRKSDALIDGIICPAEGCGHIIRWHAEDGEDEPTDTEELFVHWKCTHCNAPRSHAEVVDTMCTIVLLLLLIVNVIPFT